MTKRQFIIGLFWVIAIIVAILVGNGAQGRSAPAPKTCVSGAFIVESPLGGMLLLGEQSICGYGLEFGPLSGPAVRQ